MKRNRNREIAATKAADFLRKKFKIKKPIRLGIILGTGWGDKLKIENPQYINFEKVPGFSRLGKLEGHNRRFVHGTVAGKEVIVLQGRIHLNEEPCSLAIYLMVRLQTEILMKLGVKTLITTCAAGALPKSKLEPGCLVVIDGFVSLYVPLPLWVSEFASPDDVLSKDLMKLALQNRKAYNGKIVTGGYVMVLGPNFEGRKYDKLALSYTGAKAVGMSTIPEVAVAALYKTRVLSLAFITNDAVGIHSHEDNIKKAKQFSGQLGSYLSSVIKAL